MSKLHVVGIVGSLRRHSFQRAVFDAAVELASPAFDLREADIAALPLYNADVEADGDPDAVSSLKKAVGAADGLIVFTPEYNRSMPAVTKNAIDWLSRPAGASALGLSAVGIVASTPGRHDAAGVRAHLSQSVGAVTPRLFEPTLGIASISRKVADGVLEDEATREELAGWLHTFAEHVRTTSPASDDGS